MSGIVSSITSVFGGKSDAEKRADRAADRAAEDAAKRAEAQRLADTDREARLAKQRQEEDLIAQSKKKKQVRQASGVNRNIFSSPLGLDNETLA